MNSTPAASWRDLDIFVRLMRLVDRARPADNGRNSRLLELPGLAGIGDGDRRVTPAEFQRQAFRRRTGRRIEARHRMMRMRFDARALCRIGSLGGDDPLDLRIHVIDGGVIGDIRQAAKFPIEGALLGENVARRAAVDDADMDGGEWRVETPARIAFGLQLIGETVKLVDQRAGDFDGAGAEIGFRGMRLVAMHDGVIGGDALVRVGDFHQRGLADDGDAGARQIRAESRDRIERAAAADLLVVAEQDMNRPLEIGVLEFRNHRQAERVEALHVASAARIDAAAVAAEREGVRCPALSGDGNAIRVAGEDDSAVDPGADGGEQRRLVAGRVRHFDVIDAMSLQIVLTSAMSGRLDFTLSVSNATSRASMSSVAASLSVESMRRSDTISPMINGNAAARADLPGRRKLR